MKKGFTFAELMISLLVISVLSAILYPTIAQFTPNSNKPLFKSAYKTLTNVLYEITNESTTGELPTTANGLCTAFCNKANVIRANDTDTCETLCENGTIQTNNGMRWYFSAFNYAGIVTFIIYVDVNASNNNLTPEAHGTIPETPWGDDYTGVFYYDDSNTANIGIYTALPTDANPEGTFNANNLKAQDTFEIIVNKKGKITHISAAGWAHLSDSTQSPD